MDDREFFAQWGISFARRCTAEIQGSPNRSAEHFVFEDQTGTRYIAEGFELEKKRRQRTQCEVMEFLAGRGLPVIPWLRTREGESGVTGMARLWQVRPFIDADPLPRATLGDDRHYAELWQEFLLKLENVSHDPALPLPRTCRFLVSGALPMILHHVRHKMPELSDATAACIAGLHDFAEAEAGLPVMLAHGDFHPGNVLVKAGKISAVIDWEFANWKCAGYDLALLIGCLGRDDRRWLTGSAVTGLKEKLFQPEYLPEAAKKFFVKLMAAIRIGWLGEWADLGERQLAEEELDYIRCLLETR